LAFGIAATSALPALGCHFARKRYKSSLVSCVDGTGAGGRAMERKLLQAAVAIAGFAGVFLELTGVLFGTMYADLSGDVVLDSHVRFGKLWQRHVAGVTQRSVT
jgi:hypothetical protein